MARYDGAEDTTRERVIRYLRENYAHADGAPVTQADAVMAADAHRRFIDRAIDPFNSAAYYPGNQIGREMGWQELPEEPEGEEEGG